MKGECFMKKKRLLIGVIAIEPNYERTANVIEGIISQAFHSDCDIAVLSSVYHLGKTVNRFRRAEQNIFELILSEKFDGFLYDSRFVFNPEVSTHLDKLLKQSGKPVMLIDGGDSHPYFENTAADDSRPFRNLTEHLITEHGFQKIYCLTGPAQFPDAVQRLSGYFEAMEKHHLYYDKNYYFYGDYWKDSAKELAEKIISGTLEKPEAIVCGNDISAKALIESLMNGGIRVPEEIAVAGFDCETRDFDADSRITSYRRDNFQLGADAFRRLYRTLTGAIPSRIKTHHEGIRIGMTCGCRKLSENPVSKRREKIVRKIFHDGLDRTDMILTLSQEQNFSDALRKIVGNAFYFYKMRHFCICLTEIFAGIMRNQEDTLKKFSHQSRMQISAERFCNGELTVPETEFSADEVLPFFGQEKPCAYFLTSLHSEDDCFGYTALSFGKLPCVYDDTYIQYINAADTLLTLYQKRQSGVYLLENYQKDAVTDFMNLQTLKENLQRIQKKFLIYLEITGFKLLFCQYTPEEFNKKRRYFADTLRNAVPETAFCCSSAPDSFIILTNQENLSERLFQALKHDSGLHQLPFTIGETEYQSSDFYRNLQQAMLKICYTYTIQKRKEQNPLFEKLCQLQAEIRSHPENEWHIDEIAENLHISRGHLQKSYKQFFGSGIIETVISLRMEKAKNLLISTEKSITEIAELCGYTSYIYFTKQFRKAESLTPSAYREKYKK